MSADIPDVEVELCRYDGVEVTLFRYDGMDDDGIHWTEDYWYVDGRVVYADRYEKIEEESLPWLQRK